MDKNTADAFGKHKFSAVDSVQTFQMRHSKQYEVSYQFDKQVEANSNSF